MNYGVHQGSILLQINKYFANLLQDIIRVTYESTVLSTRGSGSDNFKPKVFHMESKLFGLQLLYTTV